MNNNWFALSRFGIIQFIIKNKKIKNLNGKFKNKKTATKTKAGCFNN